MVSTDFVDDVSYDSDGVLSDDENYDNFPLSIEDWQIKYSDELWYMWDMIQELLKDAFLEHTIMTNCTFSDFAEFCYVEHHDECDFVWIPYESTLSYIWGYIQDYLEDLGLYNEMMPGATYDHWVKFAAQHSTQNNITIY